MKSKLKTTTTSPREKIEKILYLILFSYRNEELFYSHCQMKFFFPHKPKNKMSHRNFWKQRSYENRNSWNSATNLRLFVVQLIFIISHSDSMMTVVYVWVCGRRQAITNIYKSKQNFDISITYTYTFVVSIAHSWFPLILLNFNGWIDIFFMKITHMRTLRNKIEPRRIGPTESRKKHTHTSILLSK